MNKITECYPEEVQPIGNNGLSRSGNPNHLGIGANPPYPDCCIMALRETVEGSDMSLSEADAEPKLIDTALHSRPILVVRTRE